MATTDDLHPAVWLSDGSPRPLGAVTIVVTPFALAVTCCSLQGS